jgi:hypothetical protein
MLSFDAEREKKGSGGERGGEREREEGIERGRGSRAFVTSGVI